MLLVRRDRFMCIQATEMEADRAALNFIVALASERVKDLMQDVHNWWNLYQRSDIEGPCKDVKTHTHILVCAMALSTAAKALLVWAFATS